jgi:hypothetical protein
MAQIVEKTSAPPLGALLQEHHQAAMLGRELIRIALCARVANRIDEAVAAEEVAEEYIAKSIQLEERLRGML